MATSNISDDEEKEDEKMLRSAQFRAARKCSNMMKMARDDTDRIAVLAVIPKLMTRAITNQSQTEKEKENMDEICFCLLAESIPIDFMQRLFETTHDDGDLLALCVFARLLSSEKVVNSQRFDCLFDNMLSTFRGRLENNSLQTNSDAVDDMLFCMSKLANDEKTVEEFWIVATELVKAFPDKAMDAAFSFFSLRKGDVGQVENYFHGFLNVLLRRIKTDETPAHFDLLQRFAKWGDGFEVFQNANATSVEILQKTIISNTWFFDLRQIIRDILQSRRTDEHQRRLALILADTMTRNFDFLWLGGDAKLFQLLANLACIDVRLFLDREPSAQMQAEGHVFSMFDYLARLLHFLEKSLTFIADDFEEKKSNVLQLSERQALQMNDALLELTNFVLDYFSATFEDENAIPETILFCLYRFVCAYLSEGLALVRQQSLANAAQPILALVKRLSDADRVPTESPSSDPLRFLLPPVSQLAELGDEWETVKKTFLQHGFSQLLERFLSKHEAEREQYGALPEAWKPLKTSGL